MPGEKDDLIAAALACGRTWKEAAAAAGVSESTVGRRMADPGFRRAVADLRAAVIDRTFGLLSEALADGVAGLHLAATDGESEGVRLRACVAILELTLRYREQCDLAERVRRLEENAGLGGGGGAAGEVGEAKAAGG